MSLDHLIFVQDSLFQITSRESAASTEQIGSAYLKFCAELTLSSLQKSPTIGSVIRADEASTGTCDCAGRQVGQLAPAVLAILLMITPGLADNDSNEAWAALVKGGHVAVIRHGNVRRPATAATRRFQIGRLQDATEPG